MGSDAASVILTSLGASSTRIRDASNRASSDDVLDVLAEDARKLGDANHAWCASLDGSIVVALRSTSAPGEAPSESFPPLTDLVALAQPVGRLPGYVACALPGFASTLEGILVVSDEGMKDLPMGTHTFDLALTQLALHGGLALEAVRLRQRIDAVTKAREALLASVSHDLRNPLNTFAMSAGLLRDDLERNDIDATRGLTLVSRMDRASTRMQGMIEDLVEASRVDARTVDFATRPEPAAQLVRDAVAAAAPKPSEKSAAVTADALDDDAQVLADRARTLQALSRLVAFATKATGDSGAIRIGVRRDGERVVFTVRGFGPNGSTVAAPPEGRGGLAILLARGLVEAQKGTFTIEPGDALGVSFTLPAAKG